MKRLVTLITALVMAFVLATGVSAQAAGVTASQEIAVVLNGEKLEFGDHAPFIEKGTTLVPARDIFEELGYKVAWNKENGVVTAEKYGLSVALQIDHAVAYLNGYETELTVAPKLYNNTVYVPIRFISEAIGYHVEWKSDIRSVILSKQPSKGYIWKVEKEGVEVHLLGSVHFGNEKMYPLRDEIEQAFDDSDHLVMEINLAQLPDEPTLKEIEAIQQYSDGTTLKDHLSAETYARLQSLLEALQLPSDSFDNVKPWAIQLQLNALMALSSGYEGGLGIDMYYLNRAQLAEKPILELESYMLQFKMFDSFSQELQEAQINGMLDVIFGLADETNATEPPIDVLAQLWIAGDDQALEELITEFQKADLEYYEKLLKNRHDGMLEKIEAYLNSGNNESYFVIVGYLHLLGEHGLVTQLKEKGYTVTRL